MTRLARLHAMGAALFARFAGLAYAAVWPTIAQAAPAYRNGDA
jgi:hypothetical protein